MTNKYKGASVGNYETHTYNMSDIEDCDWCAEVAGFCPFHKGVDWGFEIAVAKVAHALEIDLEATY